MAKLTVEQIEEKWGFARFFRKYTLGIWPELVESDLDKCR